MNMDEQSEYFKKGWDAAKKDDRPALEPLELEALRDAILEMWDKFDLEKMELSFREEATLTAQTIVARFGVPVVEWPKPETCIVHGENVHYSLQEKARGEQCPSCEIAYHINRGTITAIDSYTKARKGI